MDMEAKTLAGTAQPNKDGRIARGERTRRRVAEALIALLEEGDLQPTAKEIAARAGVSLRLVFHHFDDMDALYHAVADINTDRNWRSLYPIPPDLALHHRVERTVRQRYRLYEAITPVRRAAVRQAYHSEEVALTLLRSNQALRDQLAETFALELKAAAGEGRDILEALDLATSWEAWDRLRATQGITSTAARRVTERIIMNLLDRGTLPY
jgi:AcrR family transcriptional regulator